MVVMKVHAQSRRSAGSRSLLGYVIGAAFLTLMLVILTGCGGGSFDSGDVKEQTLFLGTTNLQEINDYFVTFEGSDTLTCAEPGCHGSSGAAGGGGFKFQPLTWSQMTPEEQLTQQFAFEQRVEITNKPISTILLRATESSHSGSIHGNIPRYTAGDQIYTWIEEWLQSTPAQ